MANQSTQEVVEKVQKLAALAQSTGDDGEPTEEARNAGVKLAALMKQHDLALIPKDQVDKAMKMIEGAREFQKRAQAEANKKLIIGGALGYLLGGGKFGR